MGPSMTRDKLRVEYLGKVFKKGIKIYEEQLNRDLKIRWVLQDQVKASVVEYVDKKKKKKGKEGKEAEILKEKDLIV